MKVISATNRELNRQISNQIKLLKMYRKDFKLSLANNHVYWSTTIKDLEVGSNYTIKKLLEIRKDLRLLNI